MLYSSLLKWEALGGRSGVVSVGALFGSAEGSQPAMMRPVTNKLNKHAHFFLCIATTSTYKMMSCLLTVSLFLLGFSGMFSNHKIKKVICTSANTLNREGKTKTKQKF